MVFIADGWIRACGRYDELMRDCRQISEDGDRKRNSPCWLSRPIVEAECNGMHQKAPNS
jgi:hypothetical protein